MKCIVFVSFFKKIMSDPEYEEGDDNPVRILVGYADVRSTANPFDVVVNSQVSSIIYEYFYTFLVMLNFG